MQASVARSQSWRSLGLPCSSWCAVGHNVHHRYARNIILCSHIRVEIGLYRKSANVVNGFTVAAERAGMLEACKYGTRRLGAIAPSVRLIFWPPYAFNKNSAKSKSAYAYGVIKDVKLNWICRSVVIACVLITCDFVKPLICIKSTEVGRLTSFRPTCISASHPQVPSTTDA